MKIDGEQVICHGTFDNKANCKPFGYNKISQDSIGLKSGHVIVNEHQNGVFSDLKAREGNADQLQYPVNDEKGWTASKLDSCTNVNRSTHDNEKEVTDFVASMPLDHSSLKVESFDKDAVFYIDKNVMEPELPELVVCYKENTYHVVKDICIDEGVPSQDKFLFDTGVDEKKLCTFLIPDDINSNTAKERVDLDMNTPHLSENEFSLKCDSKALMPIEGIEENAMEKNSNFTSKEIFSLGELLSMPDVGAELLQAKASPNIECEAEHSSLQSQSENTISATASAYEKSKNSKKQALFMPSVRESVAGESGHEEAMLGNLTPDSTAKAFEHGHDSTVLASPSNSANLQSENGVEEEKLPSHFLGSESTSTIGDELCCNSKVESNSTTFNAPRANGGDEGSKNGSSEDLETRNSSRHEDTSSEPFSGQLQCSLGESSFSAAGPVSGLISYSGPITYSGSLSLRSDSSTTSTRSFAFPILQSEWNSSPVRMAKADPRHYRKHRSWKHSLLCCRF